MNFPLVTIICTCYNHEKYIIETLNSVIKQSYKNIQLIIVDDFSSDSSVIKINDWLINYNKGILFIRNKENLGLNKSFNSVFKNVKGSYVIDLAADDILKLNCVEKQLNKFNTTKYSNIAVVYGNAKFISKDGSVIGEFLNNNEVKKLNKVIFDGVFYEKILFDSRYICSTSSMFKKEVFEKLGGYDEELFFEDFDFWIRVSRYYCFDFIDDILVEKRVLENSLGNGFFVKSDYTLKLNLSMYKILLKAYKLNKNQAEYNALINRIFRHLKWAIKNVNIFLIIGYLKLFLKIISPFKTLK